MKTTWALQDAKNRFSEVVESALREGPQTITRRGKETAILISVEDFQKLTGKKETLVSFFKNSPLKDVTLDLERSDDYGRDIAL